MTLTAAQAAELVAARREALVQTGRVEFGSGVTERLIRAFYTSPYLTKETYAETVQALTELFYQLKNETDDRGGACRRQLFSLPACRLGKAGDSDRGRERTDH